MSTIADLSKGVAAMTDEELHARIRELRVTRTIQPESKPRAKRAPANAGVKALDVKSLTDEQKKALLELLGGLV